MEMVEGLMKEKEVVDDPNLQERLMHEKSDNGEMEYPCVIRLIPPHTLITPRVRQLTNPGLNL